MRFPGYFTDLRQTEAMAKIKDPTTNPTLITSDSMGYGVASGYPMTPSNFWNGSKAPIMMIDWIAQKPNKAARNGKLRIDRILAETPTAIAIGVMYDHQANGPNGHNARARMGKTISESW